MLLGVGSLGDGDVHYLEAPFQAGIQLDFQADEGANLVVEHVYHVLAFVGVAQALQPVGRYAFGTGTLTQSLSLGAELHQFQTGFDVARYAGDVVDGGQPQGFQFVLGAFLQKNLPISARSNKLMPSKQSKDIQMLVRLELEKNPKVRAVVEAYEELTEGEKAAFRLAVGISQDTAGYSVERRRESSSEHSSGIDRGKVQPLVQSPMKTLLEDYPSLLADIDIQNLVIRDYCQKTLGLQLGGFPLLRRVEAGRKGSDNDSQDRFYAKLYAGKFYVCSQWWKKDHLSNARNLVRFVTGLIEKNQGHPGIPTLERYKKALRDYVANQE